MRRRALLFSLFIALLAVPVLLAPAGATATQTAGAQREPTLEQAVLREVNRLRQARGLRQLTLSSPLQAAAAFQSRDMLEHGYFDHEQPGGVPFSDRLKRFYPLIGGAAWTVGENLLWSSPTITATSAVKLWLGSPPHRRNIYDPAWREVGVGVFSTPAAAGIYAQANGPVFVVTMDYGSRAAGRTTSAQRS